MILNLPSLVYAIGLILAANYDLRAKNGSAFTTMLSLGLTRFDRLWEAVGKLLKKFSPLDQPKFDQGNPAHRAAALLVMAQMAWSVRQLLLQRGESDLPFFAAGLSGILLNLLMAAIVYLGLSLLGTGWRIRRDLNGVLRRLGLRRPKPQDWLAGLASGLLIFGCVTLVASLLPSSAGDQSSARLLFDIVKPSLPAALLVAILSGVGEEIFFRGALQPVFGICASSLLFTLVHAHYGLSPELLILFFVSVGFGLARERFSTTAAIICHATYNLAPFLIYRLMPA